MTFPDNKFADVAAYFDAYTERLATAAASVDRAALAQAARILDEAYARQAGVFACGNGGSASISNHLVCDHLKGIQTDTEIRPHVHSLSTNMELVTAIANDLTYDDVFVYQLRTLAKAGDVLITISSSGDSENVVRAATWARDNGVQVIAFTGFDGGRTAGLATAHLHVEGDNYGIIEDAHQSLMHVLAQYLRQSRMKEDRIAQRKF
ncbi:MAG: SIS domain-containing protein [Rhodospirillales bacterium]|jgi:phosphoheptose isomerase|nr:SIS domain-containing protein [Rhodospirillales bacterium]HJO97990.1 SIS domain-containing protein [Rhodospirillales bacterium]